jgi:predicted tellurium resistance membrane protein TerC
MKSRKLWIIVSALLMGIAVIGDMIEQLQSHKSFHFHVIYTCAILQAIITWKVLGENPNSAQIVKDVKGANK